MIIIRPEIRVRIKICLGRGRGRGRGRGITKPVEDFLGTSIATSIGQDRRQENPSKPKWNIHEEQRQILSFMQKYFGSRKFGYFSQ